MSKASRIFRIFLVAGLPLVWCEAALTQDKKFKYLQGTDFSKHKTYKSVQIPDIEYPSSILNDQIKRAIDTLGWAFLP